MASLDPEDPSWMDEEVDRPSFAVEACPDDKEGAYPPCRGEVRACRRAPP